MPRRVISGLNAVVPVAAEECSTGAGGGRRSGGMVVEVLGKVLTLFSVVFIFLTFPISVWMCAKVIQEYERAVVFRLGRVTEGPARGPGLLWVIPWLDSIQKVDLRTVSFHIRPQEVLTADAVPLKVDAVVFFRVVDPFMWVMRVKNGPQAICLLAQMILKTAIGAHTLADLLTQELAIRKRMEMELHDASKPWGAQVERVELKAMMLPIDLQRCMASEAEAVRKARAKGEQRERSSLRDGERGQERKEGG